MKHAKEEILKALHVIKDTCYESYQEKDEVAHVMSAHFLIVTIIAY